MASRRLTCVCVPGQAGVLAVITTGSTVCGFGTLTAESVRDCRASVYAAACPPSSTAISVNRAAAAVHPSVVACVANPGYIVVCSQVSPVMESCRLAALVPTNPASTASPAKCSCSSTWAVPLNLSLIHISEPTRLLSISYAVFCLKKKKKQQQLITT